MIYCNLSDGSRQTNLEIKGTETDIRNELSVILIELKKTVVGRDLIRAALKQSEDPEWEEKYDKEIRAFPDPNRRKV